MLLRLLHPKLKLPVNRKRWWQYVGKMW